MCIFIMHYNHALTKYYMLAIQKVTLGAAYEKLTSVAVFAAVCLQMKQCSNILFQAAFAQSTYH